MRPMLLSLLLLCGLQLLAQIPRELELAHRSNCVRIDRLSLVGGIEVGCGYVLAQEGDSLIIATARHVVQDTNSRAKPPHGEVRFHGVEEAFVYHVVHLDAKDLAFVKVRRPGHVTPLPLVFRDAPLDVRLWLISARREHKALPTGFDGRMLYRSGSTPHFWAAIPGTAQGDSGSMILSKDGIVGMLLGGSSELECLAIGYVMDRLNSIVMPVGK